MRLVPLGSSGIQVSTICLGTMYLGTKLDQNQSEQILDTYLSSQGNFIDTANNYAFWMPEGTGDESEIVIGKWLKKKTRDKVILATKCGARPTYFDGDLDTMEIEGLSYDTIIKAVEDSLRRLQTDYVDVLYGHVDFMEYPVEERLKAFSLLKEQGKIRSVGTSNTWSWRIEESQNLSRNDNYMAYSCIQQKYSYLRPKYSADFWVQKLIDQQLMDYVNHREDLTLIAYSTLLSGLYSKNGPEDFPQEYQTKDNVKRWEVLVNTAEQLNCTLNQLVLAWMMCQSPRIIPIISGSKSSQIEECLKASEVSLTAEQLEVLNNAGD